MHGALALSDRDFSVFLGQFEASLIKLRVGERERRELLARWREHRDHIVTQ